MHTLDIEFFYALIINYYRIMQVDMRLLDAPPWAPFQSWQHLHEHKIPKHMVTCIEQCFHCLILSFSQLTSSLNAHPVTCQWPLDSCFLAHTSTSLNMCWISHGTWLCTHTQKAKKIQKLCNCHRSFNQFHIHTTGPAWDCIG